MAMLMLSPLAVPPHHGGHHPESPPWTALVAPAPHAGAQWMYGAKCPKKLNGALFNHVSKVGGTAFWQMLRAAFVEHQFNTTSGHVVFDDPEDGLLRLRVKDSEREEAPHLVHQEDMVTSGEAGTGVVSGEMADHYFVFGLTRRPCDFMLSNFLEETKAGRSNAKLLRELDITAKEAAQSKELFRWSVFDSLNKSAHLKQHPTMEEALATGVLSDRMAARYGARHVHCMASAHNMKADFVRCVQQYEECGGKVNKDFLKDSVLNKALAATQMHARASGRSGGQAQCNQMFDDETLAAVTRREEQLLAQFDIGGCCDARPVTAHDLEAHMAATSDKAAAEETKEQAKEAKDEASAAAAEAADAVAAKEKELEPLRAAADEAKAQSDKANEAFARADDKVAAVGERLRASEAQMKGDIAQTSKP